MYPEEIVAPMREELTSLGFKEVRTILEVQEILEKKGLLLMVINSVCGCAAGNARPAVKLALQKAPRPHYLATVFAGQDLEATEYLRSKINYPPSSPSIALFKDGKVVFMLQRLDLQGYAPDAIARKLRTAFDTYCKEKETILKNH